VCACFALSLAAAAAAQQNETAKILPRDGAAGDEFGNAVAISDDLMVIGAWFDQPNGSDSGSAYLFDPSGEFLSKLVPADGGPNEWFGVAVDIWDDVVVVGAMQANDNGQWSGAAYLFDVSDPLNPVQTFKLLPNDGDPKDFFGVSVGISGDTVIVGAWGDDDWLFDGGAAYLFDATTGEQLYKLTASDGGNDDRFGVAVAISGDVAIVGAFLDGDNGNDSGSAYLFDVASGQELMKLLADDGSADDKFGAAVAIDGERALVGAKGHEDNGALSGSAYVFDTSTGAQLHKLLASDGAPSDLFGDAVALSDGLAIVGAYLEDERGDNAGAAYLFDVATGDEMAKLLPSDGAAGDFFGFSVAIDGPLGVVGSRGDDDNGSASGSAYMFGVNSGCPADINGDGLLNVLDFVTFQLLWHAQDRAADCDSNEHFNVLDFVCFQQAFLAGCP
jgi:hypothetical protein